MIKPFEKPIYVTRPFLPPFDGFCEELKEIWESQWLTNNGPILRRFSDLLSRFFDTDNICLFNNGTLALQIALQGMEISGEVITTPFSFVATTHALLWNKIRPVFVDIEPDYYTLDPEKVESAITPLTSAILAVHVYGHPCQINSLSDIAKKHNLKLIYDSAHAFGVKIGNRSIADFGDLNLFSLHATKLYHSLEGGMLIFKQTRLKNTFNYLKNFGFKNELEVVMVGTNAKMNEIQALMGIQVLRYLEEIIQRRSKLSEVYRRRLVEIPGIRLVPAMSADIMYNYAYMPIEVDEREFRLSRDALYEKLKHWNIFGRRYFYPLICDYACYRSISVENPLTVARRAADRILTLPIYDSLQISDVERICEVIRLIHLGENAR
ncbi:MAG: DegT/DnrJ/EryC1/StrS family aminotransferase [Deltaproteobacteria bacterium]|nr:DegT/DnrJ/EryC1/StrS family aminotransferase [Deltaproteobacteria bacterium]